MSKNFVESLQQLDRELQQHPLSPTMDGQIRQALREKSDLASGSGFFSRWTVAQAVAVAAAVLLVLVGALYLLSPQKTTEPSSRVVGGFALLQGKVRVVQRSLHCQSQRCRLQFLEKKSTISLGQYAQIRRHQRDIQFLFGSATFEVARRAPGQGVLKIFVSHGVVEVLGTRLTIWQGKDKGTLYLHRGVVRFLSEEPEHSRTLAPGEQLHWPLEEDGAGGKGLRASPRRGRRLDPRDRPLAPPVPLVRGHAPLPQRGVPQESPDAWRPLSALPRQPSQGSDSRRAQSPQRQRVSRSARPRSRPPRRPSTSRAPLSRQAPSRPSRPPQRESRPPQREKSSSSSPPLLYPPMKRHVFDRFRAVLEEVERLRTQGRYRAAVQKLRLSLPLFSQKAAQERLHYELGSLLTHYLKDKAKACRHWRRHQHIYAPSRRYRQEIRNNLKLLRCR